MNPESDQFWQEIAKGLARRTGQAPMTPEEAQKEFESLSDEKLPDDQIEEIIDRVTSGEFTDWTPATPEFDLPEFDCESNGDLPSRIARDINSHRWPTKVYHSKRSGKTTGGGRWTARQIVDTLRNPVYISRSADGKETRDGCHDPIVDQATFDAVQRHLDARRTTSRPRRTETDHFPFRQKIVCPGCGRMLSTYQVIKRHGPRAGVIYNYYRCRSTSGGRPPCKGIQYRAWDIEEGVRAILDEPQTWRGLLGPDATDESIHQAMDAWRVMLWQWQRDWLRNAIEQIEIDEAHDMIAVTFKADAGAVFLLENAPV